MIFPVFQVFWLKPAIVDRIFGAVVVREGVVDSVEVKDGVQKEKTGLFGEIS